MNDFQKDLKNNSPLDNQSDYYWKCTVCGQEYDSETLPENYVCPVCGAFAPKFERRSRSEDNE